MSDFSALDPYNWRAAASIVIQLAFLIGGVWFASNLLKTMRAFQEQIGALLKLSITSTPGERQSTNANARNVLAEGSPYWLPPSLSTAASVPEVVERGPSLFAASWQRVMHWLREPMESARVSYRRRVINWLQAPAGH